MSTAYDIVIVGAGIHGAGVAQAAAAAGYSALVLEQTAVAAGTSSRSSKLIHGGLRYLETGQLTLVREALAERERLLALAPGLVKRTAFYIPVYKTTARRPWTIRAGLSLYALLAGLGRHSLFAAVPRREWAALDGLETRGLKAVFRYYDAQTDDAALTRAVMRSAERLGAELACPARFVAAQRCAAGFEIRYATGGREASCLASALVNAAGPWVERVLENIAPPPARLPIELVQGTHIVVEGELGRGVYYVESPCDRRALFVMPWRGAILVGTTETPFAGDPALIQPLPREIDYLQAGFLQYFPAHRGRVLDAFAGLRVLPQDETPAFNRSRETVLHADATGRLVTIYGGKLTTYRTAAARVLRLLRRTLPSRTARADTAHLPLGEAGH